MKKLIHSSVLALLLSAGFLASADATILYSNTTPTGDTALPGSYTYAFSTGSAKSAVASFQLQGYNSLDGRNGYEDDFTLSLNGTAIYKATFDLGGGGSNVVIQAPSGASFTVTPTSNGNPTFAGGLADIMVPVMLAGGLNTFTLSYDSVQSPGGAGNQGIGDEGFGVNKFVVSSVPLPASAPLFGAALLALGAVGYGVKRKKAATAA